MGNFHSSGWILLVDKSEDKINKMKLKQGKKPIITHVWETLYFMSVNE